MPHKRSRLRRYQNLSQPAEVLENRSLLAAVVGAISIDGQAPEVLGQVNGVDILAVSDDDSTRLFSSVGTQAGTVEFSDVGISKIHHVEIIGQNMFLIGSNGEQTDLWRTTGAPNGALLIKSDVSFSEGSEFDFAVLNDEIYFRANSDDPTVGVELYKSDGSAAELVADIAPGLQTTSLTLQPDRGVRFEIWVNEIDPETSQPIQARVIHEFDVPAADRYEASLPDGAYRYWIRPTDDQGNTGAWSSSRDVYVSNTVNGSNPGGFTIFNNEIYFAATTPNSGRELWRTDGTTAGTERVDPLNGGVDEPFKLDPSDLTEFDGHLFFSSQSGISRTDGTTISEVDLGLDRVIHLIGVANDHLFAVDTPRFGQNGDTIGLFSLSSAADTTPEQLHRIDLRVDEGTFPAYSRFDSFAVVDDELVFLSVQHTATNSYNLSPSEDRHLPSSVPRNWFEKEGRWYRSDGTAAGTTHFPGFAYEYAEDETDQVFNDFRLHETVVIGGAELLVDNDVTTFSGSEVRRVAPSDDAAVIGNHVLAASREEDLMSVVSGQIREENITFEDVSAVDAFADSFWVSAADGDGTALFQVDLETNDQPGPAISGLDTTNAVGLGPIALRPEGFVSFSWTDDGHSTYDVLINRVSYQYDKSPTPLVALEGVSETSHEEDLSPGTYRVQVRSRAANGIVSLWSEVLVRVTESQLDGPPITSPVQNSNPTFYDTAPVSWQTAGFGDAVSFDIQTTAGLIKGVTGSSTVVPTAPGTNTVSVRARYADGTVSRFGSLSTFFGVPAPTITPLFTDGGASVAFRLDPSVENQAIYYTLTDVDTAQRISSGSNGFARENNLIVIAVPYSGRFRVTLRTTIRTNSGELHSRTSEYTFNFDVDHDESKAFIQSGVDGTQLSVDWHHPDAQSYDVSVYYHNDPTHGSALITQFQGIEDTSRVVSVPAASNRFRVVVSARNSAGQLSQTRSQTISRDVHPAVSLTEGRGTQATSRPTFRWDAPYAGSPDVVRYELLLVGENETYRRSNLQSTSHTADSDLGTGRYLIYLRAHFADGTASPWNVDEGVLVLTSSVSGPPQITGPASSVSTSRPLLEWQQDAAASHYEVWLSTESDVAPVIHATQVMDNELAPNVDLAAGQYRMWVRTHYGDGSKTRWSPTYRFTVIESDVVQITSGTGTQPAGQQTIGWNAVPNAESYELYINELGTRHTATYRQTGISATSHVVGVTLEAGKSYEVWVRAHLANGSRTRWGSNPPILTVESGVANATPQLQINGNTASWAAISGATEYELWVNEVNPSNPNQTIRARAFREFVTGTTQDMGLAAGTYRGWLRAVGADGTRSAWSDAVTFVIS